MANEIFIDTVPGTGAAINVVTGFIPDHVRLVNASSGETLEWFNGQADMVKVVAAGAITTPVSTIVALEDATNGEGFTIGLDADVNVNGENICIFATRGGLATND